MGPEGKRFTYPGYIAIRQPKFVKIDVKVTSGFAYNSNRVVLTTSEVVLGYSGSNKVWLSPGDKVILHGDAGAHAWAKQIFSLDGEEFVLCPESSIVGYERASKARGGASDEVSSDR